MNWHCVSWIAANCMNCPCGHNIRCNSIHGGGETPTRNHGEANSWCASINSSIKTNRARIEGFFLLLLLFLLYKGLGLAHRVFDLSNGMLALTGIFNFPFSTFHFFNFPFSTVNLPYAAFGCTWFCAISFDELTLRVIRWSFRFCKSEVIRFAHSEVLLFHSKVKLSSPI